MTRVESRQVTSRTMTGPAQKGLMEHDIIDCVFDNRGTVGLEQSPFGTPSLISAASFRIHNVTGCRPLQPSDDGVAASHQR